MGSLFRLNALLDNERHGAGKDAALARRFIADPLGRGADEGVVEVAAVEAVVGAVDDAMGVGDVGSSTRVGSSAFIWRSAAAIVSRCRDAPSKRQRRGGFPHAFGDGMVVRPRVPMGLGRTSPIVWLRRLFVPSGADGACRPAR